MTWYYNFVDGNSEVEIYDHTGANVATITNPDAPAITRDAQGVPIKPDVRKEIVTALVDRGQADVYAILAVAEALTGAGFEEGTPS